MRAPKRATSISLLVTLFTTFTLLPAQGAGTSCLQIYRSDANLKSGNAKPKGPSAETPSARRSSKSQIQLSRLSQPSSKSNSEYPIGFSSRFDAEYIQTAKGKKLVIVEGQTIRGVISTIYDYGEFTVEIVKPYVKQDIADRSVFPKSMAEAREKLKHYLEKHGKPGISNYDLGRGKDVLTLTILEQLNFVFERYITEKGWPSSFLRKLTQIAFDYAYQSTYIIVRAKILDAAKNSTSIPNEPGAGQIIGSVRLINTPYLSVEQSMQGHGGHDPAIINLVKQKLHDEQEPLVSGFDLSGSFMRHEYYKHKAWNEKMWKDIFGSDMAELSDVQRPLRFDGDLAYIPAPFELALNRNYVGERNRGLKGLEYFVEPGNFAIIADRDLPENLRQVAAPALYFHLARLIRQEAGLHGPAVKVGTYASEGSTSDRFYQSLGFKIHDTINPNANKESQNPTDEVWNVLMGNGYVLNEALIKRFQLEDSADGLNKLFQVFDTYERETLEKSFFVGVVNMLIETHIRKEMDPPRRPND